MRTKVMKKEYKKPNICAVDFEILDLILTSEAVNPDDDWGWEFDSIGDSLMSYGGYRGVGF